MTGINRPATRVVSIAVVAWFSLSASGFGQVDAEAISGVPFGVGRMTVPVRNGGLGNAVDASRFELIERSDRAVYPAFTTGRAFELVGNLLGAEAAPPARSVTVFFLFTGDEPLSLSLNTTDTHSVVIAPQRRRRPRAHSRLLARWWRQYNAALREQSRAGDYPPILETYLTTMLSQRLGLKPPLLTRIKEEKQTGGELKRSLDLLLGTEAMRAKIMKDTMSGAFGPSEVADLALPRPVAPPPAGENAADIDVEPIAMHVPEECFYIRFGRFGNYLWLSHLLEEYGGDLSRMVTLRSHDAGLNGRVERQLALKQTVLADILGGQVIADVALIGRDTFLKEGAAIGILFEARNGILTTQINQQRAAALKQHRSSGATVRTENIAGHDVSLLATPDNRLRSFYAIDGRYHLVTTSRTIVRRFYEAGAGRRPLGRSRQFQYARTVMPLEREDTVFVYLGGPFFEGLVSPQYRVERRRRLRAVTDIELLQMARLAARAESQPGQTIDDLIAARLLPPNFGNRADSSRPVIQEGRIVDSMRGSRGTFTPVADVVVERVTPTERRDYEALQAFYHTQWRQMDPLMVGIRRFALDRQGLERITVEAHVSPFDKKKYGAFTSRLGPPTRQQIAPVPGDIISLQAVLAGGFLSPGIDVHHLFVGVRDTETHQDVPQGGRLAKLKLLKSIPGYLGAWPAPGLLDLLPLGLVGEPDPAGYSRLPLGLWRRQFDDYSVLSFDPAILETVTGHLHPEEAENAAQVRVHAGDVSTAAIAGSVNALSYDRARQASAGNTHLMHMLTQQFRVPRQDALATAQTLLDAKLICALGGQYRLVEGPDRIERWVSSAWARQSVTGDVRVPDDYRAPLLSWFRGCDAEVLVEGDKLLVQAQVDMQRKAGGSKVALPLLNLFGGKGPKPLGKPSPKRDRPAVEKPTAAD